MRVQEDRLRELQQAQAEKIHDWKTKILQLDYKALKLGLDLGTDWDENRKDK